MKETIICYIASLTRGGAEKVMAGLANYMVNREYNVYLVTLEPEEGLYPLDKRLRQVIMSDAGPIKNSDFPEDGIKYISKEDAHMPSLKGLSRIKAAAGRVLNLHKFIKDAGAVSVLSFMGKTNLRAIAACFGTGAASYVSVRSAPSKEYPGRVRSTLARLLFCFADGIIFQSRGAMEFFPKICHKKARIILNPLDKAYFEKIKEVKKRKEIVTAGRLSAIKNHLLLINAFYIFHKTHPEYTLTIYGEGECRRELESRIESLGLVGIVRLPGDEKNIRDSINGASLFVMSSDFEGMPNAIAEAMALKIPVVATDAPSGGIRMLVGNNERGLLCPVNDPEKMAEAMTDIIDDDNKAFNLSREAYRFSKGLHPDIIHRQWIDFLTGN